MKFLSTWLRNIVVGVHGGVFAASSMKFLSTWLRNMTPPCRAPWATALLNEVPEHMAQEYYPPVEVRRVGHGSSMKFLSTWLRNIASHMGQEHAERSSSMKFLSTWLRNIQSEKLNAMWLISSMKFLSTWLRNRVPSR